MPHLKKDFRVWDSMGGEDENDKQWLLAVPEMKGVFAMSNEGVDNSPTPFTIKEQDVELDEETSDIIYKKHREQLYYPASETDKNSLFWDECLEELRFFQGEHQHTLVPRDFPHSPHLPIWVEIQRARYLLQCVGLFSLMGWQMLVLEELGLGNVSNLSCDSGILANRCLDQKDYETKRKGKKGSSSPEKKTWNSLLSDFGAWYQKLSPEDKPHASELLPESNWGLFVWCWRQCNAASAVLCMTPILGISMSDRKLKSLASANFFHAFPYNKRNGLVCEDDYEGHEAFNSTFQILEDFSIKYGTTHIPHWYQCDPVFLRWVSALENGLSSFVKGEPCVLSVHQIERLILIGFFNDRDALPNLSKGDVVWLKMLLEFKRHRALFGVDVSKGFPRLHDWVSEHKRMFRLSRMGKRDMMKPSRLKLLMEAGVDFFTGDCIPNTDPLSHAELEEFELLTLSPTECFPIKVATTPAAVDAASATTSVMVDAASATTEATMEAASATASAIVDSALAGISVTLDTVMATTSTNMETTSATTSSAVDAASVPTQLPWTQPRRHSTNRGLSLGDDSYWINKGCQAKFEELKAKNGSSLILATDDEDVYWWLVEKRGKILRSKLDHESNKVSGPKRPCSLSILRYITDQKGGDDTELDRDVIEASQSMVLWSHYCERLMMYKGKYYYSSANIFHC